MSTIPYITPILPVLRKDAFDDPQWLFEIKYDGFRCMLFLENGTMQMWSKKGNRLHFPRLKEQLLRHIKADSIVLDGEICSMGTERNVANRPIFKDLIGRRGNIVYIAFDILWLNGQDLREKTLLRRKSILKQKVLGETSGCIRRSFYAQTRGTDLFEAIVKQDLEGIVAKELKGTYSKHTTWYKIKNRQYSQNIGRPTFNH